MYMYACYIYIYIYTKHPMKIIGKRGSIHQHLLEAISETTIVLELRQVASIHHPLWVAVVYRIGLSNNISWDNITGRNEKPNRRTDKDSCSRAGKFDFRTETEPNRTEPNRTDEFQKVRNQNELNRTGSFLIVERRLMYVFIFMYLSLSLSLSLSLYIYIYV